MTHTKAKKKADATITTLAPWYGGNRMLGPSVGRALAGCEWVGIPFMGGGPELNHIDARTIVANDLHRHVINLATIAADPHYGPQLYRTLRRMTFHPDKLAAAQDRCGIWADVDPADAIRDGTAVAWAVDYFVCCWMGRSAKAGTDDEFSGRPAIRWEAGGGDSAVRFRNATKAILAWRRFHGRVTFECLDAFDFLAKCKDRTGHGVYVDAPWPEDGDNYRHKFTEADQRRLAERLGEFSETRVVIRYGDHPLIHDLYPVGRWHWIEQTGRTAANKDKAEVLILSQP